MCLQSYLSADLYNISPYLSVSPGDKVTTSHGNSNLSKYGAQNTLLIGDGCAIGAYIQDLVLTGSALYLPESFEYF